VLQLQLDARVPLLDLLTNAHVLQLFFVQRRPSSKCVDFYRLTGHYVHLQYSKLWQNLKRLS